MSWRGDRNHLNDPNVPDFLDALEHGNHEGHGHRNFNNGMQSAEHNYLGQPQESPSPYHQMNWPGIMAPMGFDNMPHAANLGNGPAGYPNPLHDNPGAGYYHHHPFNGAAGQATHYPMNQHASFGNGIYPPYATHPTPQNPSTTVEFSAPAYNMSFLDDLSARGPPIQFANHTRTASLPSSMAVENTPLSATDHISAQLNSSNPPELSLGSESTDSNADDSADGDYEPDNEGLGVQEENDDEAEEDNKDSDEDVKSKAKANAKSRAHRSASKSEPISVAQSFADRVNAIGSGNGDLKAEFEEVQKAMRAAMAKDSMEKFGPKYAKTLMPQPGDRLVELAYVNEMIAAVKNKEGILDNPDKKGQSQGMKFVDGLDDVTIRMKCFELYFKACDAYQGIKLTPEYHNVTKRQEVAVKDFDGYIQKIIHGLKTCKSVCKSVFDATFIDRYAEGPEHEVSQKEANKKINGTRDKQNKMGRLAIAAGVTPEVLEDHYHTPEKDHLTPTKLAGSRKNSGLPQTPSKRTPAGNGTKLSTGAKRKAGVGLAQHEDDSTLLGTPSKKSRPVVNRKLSFSTPDRPVRQSPQLTGMHSARGPSMLSQSHTPNADGEVFDTEVAAPNNSQTKSAVTVSKKTSDIPSVDGASDPANSITAPVGSVAQESQYKAVICALLRLNSAEFKDTKLEVLRGYAHAYDPRFRNQKWSLPGFTNFYLISYGVHFNASPEKKHHIGMVDPSFTKIALARGDLLSKDFKQTSEDHHANNFIVANGDTMIDAALGIVENPCGQFQYN